MSIVLTVAEIIDLARFAGVYICLDHLPEDDNTEDMIKITEAHPEGALDEDTGKRIKTRYIALYEDYPEEGCFPLGPELEGS